MPNYSRVRDLPEADRDAFEKWLDDNGATRPLMPRVPKAEQDAYFAIDYARWKDGRDPVQASDWFE